MARKPSSVFVIAATPDRTISVAGQAPAQLAAWRVPLHEGEDQETVAYRHYANQPIGTTIFVVEDTKVGAYQVGFKLEVVDDPRLKEEGDDAEAGSGA